MALKSKYVDGQFWADTADRVIATFAQAAVGTLTADSAGILDVNFQGVVSVAGLAALVALLTSVAFRGNSEKADDNFVPPAPTF